ncbi:centromere protein X isoform X1 [Scyliorhinus canicula]|uniref:centromere protein X isoform X1 n=1 Tax=Scyliorhinus canicula TaxID=7830 RepID=UPI0018F3EED1|nr:centromere protein X isoform X1 [Scyliorhinus canicula]
MNEDGAAGRRQVQERSSPSTFLHKELVSKLLYFYFKDQKTKVSSDAVTIMCEMLKIFVIVFHSEAAARTARQASNEDSTTGDIEHFEKVLPQLLLDF